MKHRCMIVNSLSGLTSKREIIVLYGYIDRLGTLTVYIYLIDSQVLKVLPSALTHCQLQNLQELL